MLGGQGGERCGYGACRQRHQACRARRWGRFHRHRAPRFDQLPPGDRLLGPQQDLGLARQGDGHRVPRRRRDRTGGRGPHRPHTSHDRHDRHHPRDGRPRAARARHDARAQASQSPRSADVGRRTDHHQREQGELQHDAQPGVGEPHHRRDDPQGVRAAPRVHRGRRRGTLRGRHPPARPRLHHPTVLRWSQSGVHQEVRVEPP
jgi:hypothetical protein